MEIANPDTRHRYLVAHDYGMGGEWWWVRGRVYLRDDDEEYEGLVFLSEVDRTGAGCGRWRRAARRCGSAGGRVPDRPAG